MDFTGRTIVVTGGASGIGRATVELLRQRNADVALIHWNREVAEEVARSTGASAFVADVGNEEQMVAAFAAIDDRFGRIDGLLANAGTSLHEGFLHEERAETWDRVIEVNLRGVYLAARETIKRFVSQDRPGAVVCTSSAVAEAAIVGGGNAYNASKGAINALVRQLAVNYAGRGIRVNAVAPGATETPLMWRRVSPDDLPEMRKTIDREVPLGRIGQPLEVAYAVVWLLSDEASYVTGATLLVDGGAAAKLALSV